MAIFNSFLYVYQRVIRSKLPKIQPSLKDQASVPLLKLTDMDSQIEVFWKKFGLESSERFGHWFSMAMSQNSGT